MSFFSAGKSEITWDASAGSKPESAVVIRGSDGFYPLIGIHLTRDEAEALARQITAALATGDQS